MEKDNRHHLNFYVHIPKNAEEYSCGYGAEIAHYRRILKDPVADSLYICAKNFSDYGSGFIKNTLNELKSLTACNSYTEMCIEVAAKSVKHSDLDMFVSVGINRLSIAGASSIQPEELKKLVREALQRFPSVNADMSVKNFKSDKDTVLKCILQTAELKVPHISLYGFAEHTDFTEIREILNKHGYHAYDPFHFSLKNRECRYLINILKYRDYIGIGPGAHGCFIVNGQKHHTENPSDAESWAFEIDKKLLLTPLSNSDILEEYLLQNLTLIQGLNFKEFEDFFDESFDKVFDRTSALAAGDGNPVLTATESGIACTEHSHESVARATAVLLDYMK